MKHTGDRWTQLQKLNNIVENLSFTGMPFGELLRHHFYQSRNTNIKTKCRYVMVNNILIAHRRILDNLEVYTELFKMWEPYVKNRNIKNKHQLCNFDYLFVRKKTTIEEIKEILVKEGIKYL